MEIEEELKANAQEIDKIIEKYIPKHYDEVMLEFTLGKPRFSYDKEIVNKTISEPIWELLLRGGKRWRPTLMLLICEALGGDVRLAKEFVVLPEIIHNGTLIVDDVEDNSDIRRGKPSIHNIYGIDVAINAGNAMYYLPLLSVMKSNLPSNTKIKIYELYIQEMINLSFGQAMDIGWHNWLKDNVTEEQYLQMCLFKTGCLSRFSAKLGAILANASEKETEIVGRFAESIGIAFQIQDDILNIAPSQKWGKEKGEDITEGKMSLLVIYALNHLDEKRRERLKEILKKHTRNRKEIEEAIDIIISSGAIEYAKVIAKTLVEDGIKELDKILPESRAKILLKKLAEFFTKRDI